MSARELMEARVREEEEEEEDEDEGEELTLQEILTLYNQPINEEQAWAVCYQCCRTLAERGGPGPRRAGLHPRGVIEGPEDVWIHQNGTVRVCVCVKQVIESLGIMIYKALDYGLKENEERELSPPLEKLIDLMTNTAGPYTDPCRDEGYEATEEEEEEEGRGCGSGIRRYRDVLKLCTSHLPSPEDAPAHYQAVCRALYAETLELRTFLDKIRSAKENLRKMEGDTTDDPTRDLNELQNADWAGFWVQVMRDLRNGVKLKKVQERLYNPLPFEYQLTPYEMLMDDIRAKRYKLRKVMVNGDIPPRLKKSAHEVILDFIRSRPPLNPVAARKLKPQVERPPSLHERILEEIKSERKLRPVSPDMIRRSKPDVSSPDAARKASSTLSLANGSSVQQGGASGFQRKRLQAPTLSELETSDSDVSVTHTNTPPMFLPISSTPQPERKQPAQRRHSIEKETPTNVRQFIPPSRHSSKSLVSHNNTTTTVLTSLLVLCFFSKQLCFCCRTKKFSFFTWSYTCQFCKRTVCSQCCKKVSDYHSLLFIKSEVHLVVHVVIVQLSKTSRQASSSSSREEAELPKELTEDWSSMEVCVDCKKFISDIISSSKHSLSLATKRARLKRKTQSFVLSSAKGGEYRPSERTINEV
uniref:Spire-type actin nucleation factor 1b n=1 Tax=Astyanax mexicanus TaxID=7994 RepID=A0A8B9HN82_ASTMX